MWALTSFGDTGNGYPVGGRHVLQALYHRDLTGEGQMVDTAIVNAHLLNCSYAIAYPDGRGVDRPKLDGMQTGLTALMRLYETADGWLCIVVPTQDHWHRLSATMAEAGLGKDARFASAASRKENDSALTALLKAAFCKRSAAEWFAVLDRAGVPCEVCNPNFALGMHDDPEMKRRRLVTSCVHPYVGKLDQIGLAFEFSETPATIQGPPLIVGEYTKAIMRELGYSADEIEALQKERAIMAWSPESEAPGNLSPSWQRPTPMASESGAVAAE